jgi:hypothetical protein
MDYPSELPTVALLPFHFNPLHDMESVWWLLMWMLFQHIPDNLEDHNDLTRQRECCIILFHGPEITTTRRDAFMLVQSTTEFCSALPPAFQPYSFFIRVLGRLLLKRYREVEISDKIDDSVFDTLHATLLRVFEGAKLKARVNGAMSSDLGLRWVWDNPNKRKASEGDEASSGKRLHVD